MLLGEGRHLYGIVGDEGRLDESALAGLAEDFVNQLALAHGGVNFHTALLCHFAHLVLAHALQVVAGLFLDGLQNGQTAEGCLEGDYLAVNLCLGLAVHGYADALQHLLGEGHHPVVVLVLDVKFHASELGVVVLVHTLVAEVLADLVHALETAHDEALQVQLGGNTAIQVYVQTIVVSDEGACACTTGNALQDGGLHLGVTGLVQALAQGTDHLGTLQESLLHALVHDEVHVALAETEFGVGESIEHVALRVGLHHGQGAQALCQYGQFHTVDAYLARLGAEHITLHTDEVAKVQQLLEHGVVHGGILGIGAEGIACYIHLYATLAVHQFHETGLAHNAAAHHTAGHAHHAAVLGCGGCRHVLALLVLHCGQVNELRLDIC